jgi:hypothetical protein
MPPAVPEQCAIADVFNDPMATDPHPLLAAWSEPGLVVQRGALPSIAALEEERLRSESFDGIGRPAFCRQDAALLADGRHYEARIGGARALATRENDVHDLFNALVWLRHPELKWALNARQVADIGEVGTKTRTRGQCALTHFDEAGAIVWLADDALLPAWDAHDWHALFVRERGAWGRSIAVSVFGHALVEHVWEGHRMPVAKCLVVRVPSCELAARHTAAAIVVRWQEAEAQVAAQIRSGRLLADPQELRPLPLAGIPGWHDPHASDVFVREAPCFRPLRAGRRYPAPWPYLAD